MTYDAIERSADLGRPVEIFTFARGEILWRFTSANEDVSEGGNTYTTAVIRRGPVEQGTEISRNNMRLTVPRDFPIAALYQIAPPSEVVTMTLRQFHFGDGEAIVLWTGRIVSVSFMNTEAEIILEPIYTSLRRNGLRRAYQRQCPHVLYGPACKVNATAYRVSAVVDSVSGLNVTSPTFDAQPDGYWEGGYIEWQIATGTFERRFIYGHVGAQLELDMVTLDLAVGQTVFVYPGCDHSITTCRDKFSNVLNYGGMPYIPVKNPFGSDPVY